MLRPVRPWVKQMFVCFVPTFVEGWMQRYKDGDSRPLFRAPLWVHIINAPSHGCTKWWEPFIHLATKQYCFPWYVNSHPNTNSSFQGIFHYTAYWEERLKGRTAVYIRKPNETKPAVRLIKIGKQQIKILIRTLIKKQSYSHINFEYTWQTYHK